MEDASGLGSCLYGWASIDWAGAGGSDAMGVGADAGGNMGSSPRPAVPRSEGPALLLSSFFFLFAERKSRFWPVVVADGMLYKGE